jgi:hypothetical protein
LELEFAIGKTPLSFKVLGGAGEVFDIPTLLPTLEKDKDYANLFLIYNREIKPPRGVGKSDDDGEGSNITTPKAKTPIKIERRKGKGKQTGKIKEEPLSGDMKLFQNRLTSKQQRRDTLQGIEKITTSLTLRIIAVMMTVIFLMFLKGSASKVQIRRRKYTLLL